MWLALPFLIFVIIIIPVLGWLNMTRSRTNNGLDVENLPVKAMAIQIGVLQSMVAALALLAWWSTEVDVSWWSALSPETIGIALAALTLVSAISWYESRRPLAPHEQMRARLRKISGKDPTWISATIYAGVVEEFAYRGVLTLLLASVLGMWPAAFVSAVIFGAGHLAGGWRTAMYGVIFALAMQYLVFVSGGLLLAIIVHAVYDLLAAWRGNRLTQDASEA